jgi:hypothetical protein
MWSRASDDSGHDIEDSGSDSDSQDPRCLSRSAMEQAKGFERQVLGAITQLPNSLPAMPKQIQRLWKPTSGQNILPVTMPDTHGKH